MRFRWGREELFGLDDPLLATLQGNARREERRPFPRRRFGKIHLNVNFPDLIC